LTLFWLDFPWVNQNMVQPRFLVVLQLINVLYIGLFWWSLFFYFSFQSSFSYLMIHVEGVFRWPRFFPMSLFHPFLLCPSKFNYFYNKTFFFYCSLYWVIIFIWFYSWVLTTKLGFANALFFNIFLFDFLWFYSSIFLFYKIDDHYFF
jgi:hypothetical protein